MLTTADGLRELDGYLLENLRWIYSGRHYKGNYAVTYQKLKQLGYRSLVHEYYKFKKRLPVRTKAKQTEHVQSAFCIAVI